MPPTTKEEIVRLVVAAKACKRHTWDEIARHLDCGLSVEALKSRYRRYTGLATVGDCPICGKSEEVNVEGLTPDLLIPPTDSIWERAFQAQAERQTIEGLRSAQKIIIPGAEPFGWAYISDLHLGGHTDYQQIKRDAEIIRDTPRMWASFHGDGTDNWIIQKLMYLQRDQSINHEEAWRLFISWLDILGVKLRLVVSGNHDLWTWLLAGIDRIQETMAGKHAVLYDKYEITYDLVLAEASWRVKQRHMWKGASVFNPTHGIEVGWQRGSCEFDIGVGGHTHRGTLCRPFYRHGEKKFALLTGTYSQGSYGRKLGEAATFGSGCGATIHYPDGRMQFFEDLETAADFLRFLNESTL